MHPKVSLVPLLVHISIENHVTSKNTLNKHSGCASKHRTGLAEVLLPTLSTLLTQTEVNVSHCFQVVFCEDISGDHLSPSTKQCWQSLLQMKAMATAAAQNRCKLEHCNSIFLVYVIITEGDTWETTMSGSERTLMGIKRILGQIPNSLPIKQQPNLTAVDKKNLKLPFRHIIT